MTRLLTAVLFAGLSLGVAFADDANDKKATGPSGAWVKDADGGELTFDFQSATKMVVSVEAGGNKFSGTCKLEAEKDGVLKATITESTGDLPNKPDKGFSFKFKFKIDGDKATISDFESDHEGAKAVVEGDYKKKKKAD